MKKQQLQILVIEKDQVARKNLKTKLTAYGRVKAISGHESAITVAKKAAFDFMVVGLEGSKTSRGDKDFRGSEEGMSLLKLAKDKKIPFAVVSDFDKKQLASAYKINADHIFARKQFDQNLDSIIGKILGQDKAEALEHKFLTPFHKDIISKYGLKYLVNGIRYEAYLWSNKVASERKIEPHKILKVSFITHYRISRTKITPPGATTKKKAK